MGPESTKTEGLPRVWLYLLGRAENTEKATTPADHDTARTLGWVKMTQEEWNALSLAELACPKCGTIGRLTKRGMDQRRRHYQLLCRACDRQSSELQLKLAPPVTFNWDDYPEEQQIKIQQLINVLRENPDWGSYKLQKELQRLNMGLRMKEIIKVKNAYKEGVFDG